MAEWSNAADSKSVVPIGYRGFESLSLRHFQNEMGALRCRAHEIRQTCKIGLALEHKLVGLLVGEHVLRERRAKRGEPRIDLGHALFGFRIESGTGAHKS